MSELPRTVFVLGAGTSVHAGAPVMKDFLDSAEELLLSGKLDPKDEAQFRAVFKGLYQLHEALAKSQMDLRNVESVFAAFEMAELLESGQHEIDGVVLTQAIRRLIVVTLESSIQFKWDGNLHEPRPTEEYASLASLVKSMRDTRNRGVTIITFNYDAALDYALEHEIGTLDYSLDSGVRKEVRLLKLHGSLSWAKCHNDNDGKDYVVPRALRWTGSGGWSEIREERVMMRLGSDVMKFNPERSIPGQTHSLPLIVPPTWSKREHHWGIRNVWKTAARDLGQADSIFVMGYSLPETDHFFRYLYGLGTMGMTRLKHFMVCDPAVDKGPSFRARFEGLLGPLAKERFDARPLKFGDAVLRVGEALGLY